MIFALSFLVNLSLNYDLDVCVRIQVSITGDNSLPRVQFIRLTCAIAVILLGVTIEQLSDLQFRRLIFTLIISFTLMKLFYEIDTYQRPITRINEEQKLYIQNLSKFVQALLLAIHKVLQVTQIIVLSKWFSRNWFPFFVSIWFMSGNIAKFVQDWFSCAAVYQRNPF